jgi:hypothetical protein
MVRALTRPRVGRPPCSRTGEPKLTPTPPLPQMIPRTALSVAAATCFLLSVAGAWTPPEATIPVLFIRSSVTSAGDLVTQPTEVDKIRMVTQYLKNELNLKIVQAQAAPSKYIYSKTRYDANTP